MKTASLDILEKTQLRPDQARAILKVMELELHSQEEVLATKNDLLSVELKLLATRSELLKAFHLLELKVEALRGELVRWVFTCMLGQTAVLVGAVYFILKKAP